MQAEVGGKRNQESVAKSRCPDFLLKTTKERSDGWVAVM